MMTAYQASLAIAAALLGGAIGSSQPASAQSMPEIVTVFFDPGSARINSDGEARLDMALRMYRDENPAVMIVTGGSDSTGGAAANLGLSVRRASAVVAALVDRGIPIERLQVMGKGETEPAVSTPPKTAEAQNRRVDITCDPPSGQAQYRSSSWSAPHS